MRLSLLLAFSFGTLASAVPAPADSIVVPHAVARDGWDWLWCTRKQIDKCKLLCASDQRGYIACRGPVCHCKHKPGGGGGGGKKAPKDGEEAQ